MKERPILFSGPMVRAILDGRKTVTRRVVKPQGAILTDRMARSLGVQPPPVQNSAVIPCPYGQPGDRLWVREAFSVPSDVVENTRYVAYRADACEDNGRLRWKPSIHMPRWASRILLEVVSVRVERLQDISKADAMAEGVAEWKTYLHGLQPSMEHCYAYEDLWESINGPSSWEANPWVWVVEFRRVS